MHGALLDAELLAEVYIELTGGRQKGLDLDSLSSSQLDKPGARPMEEAGVNLVRPAPLPERLGPQTKKAHHTFVAAGLGNEPLWLNYYEAANENGG